MHITPSAQRGFTLIEIIVVIGIVGILAAVVFASFSDARKNARDKAIVSETELLRLEARLYFERYGAFATNNFRDNDIGNCSGGIASNSMFGTSNDGSLSSLVLKIHEKSTLNNTGRIYCAANANTWALAVPLSATVSGSNVTAWCVDSSGASREITFAPSGDTTTFMLFNTPYECPAS